MNLDSTPATLNTLLNHELLTLEQEMALSSAVQSGRGRAKRAAINELVRTNARLCYDAAWRYAKQATDVQDFFSVGLIGLAEAAARFQPDMGARFATYARWYIGRQMENYSRKLPSGASTVTKSAAKARRLLLAFQEGFRERNGRDPSASEAAESMGLPYHKVFVLQAIGACVSLDAPIDVADGAGASLHDQIEDSSSPPAAEGIEENERMRVLREAIEALPTKERSVIRSRFGLTGRKPQILQTIAARHGITRERVRQIEAKGLRLLRSRLTKKTPVNLELAA